MCVCVYPWVCMSVYVCVCISVCVCVPTGQTTAPPRPPLQRQLPAVSALGLGLYLLIPLKHSEPAQGPLQRASPFCVLFCFLLCRASQYGTAPGGSGPGRGPLLLARVGRTREQECALPSPSTPCPPTEQRGQEQGWARRGGLWPARDRGSGCRECWSQLG